MCLLQRADPLGIQVIFASFKSSSFIYTERPILNDRPLGLTVVRKTTQLLLLLPGPLSVLVNDVNGMNTTTIIPRLLVNNIVSHTAACL